MHKMYAYKNPPANVLGIYLHKHTVYTWKFPNQLFWGYPFVADSPAKAPKGSDEVTEN